MDIPDLCRRLAGNDSKPYLEEENEPWISAVLSSRKLPRKAAPFSRDFCDSRRGLRRLVVYESNRRWQPVLLWFRWVPWPCAFLFFFVQKMWLDKPVGSFRWPAKNGRNAIELCTPSRIFSKKDKQKGLGVVMKGNNFSRTGAGSLKMVGTVWS